MLRRLFATTTTTATTAATTTATAAAAAPLQATALRRLFVHHRRTPNPDCMMFVVPNYRFLVGNQNRRELLEAEEQKKLQQERDEEDWDGPGPVKVKDPSPGEEEEGEQAQEDDGTQKKKKGKRSLSFSGSQPARGPNTESISAKAIAAQGPACERADDEFVPLASRNKKASDIHRAASDPRQVQQQKLQQRQQLKERSGAAAAAAAAAPAATEQDVDAAELAEAGLALVDATYTFHNDDKHHSPLARRIFESDVGKHIAEVVVGKDFLTVRRKTAEELADEAEMMQEKAAAEGETQEAVVTSLDTLGGLMPSDAQRKDSGGDAAKDTPEKQQEEAVGVGVGAFSPRDKLAKMYQESEAAINSNKQKKSEDDGDSNQSEQQPQQQQHEPETVQHWFDLQFHLTAAITDFLYFDEVAVDLNAEHPYRDTEPADGDSETVLAIKELLAEHVRPLLQGDGGDIKFHGFVEEETTASAASSASEQRQQQEQEGENDADDADADADDADDDADAVGVLRVELLGSCKSCKKSDTTLKDLIERTVQHYVPEVRRVVEIRGLGRRNATASKSA